LRFIGICAFIITGQAQAKIAKYTGSSFFISPSYSLSFPQKLWVKPFIFNVETHNCSSRMQIDPENPEYPARDAIMRLYNGYNRGITLNIY
jgi:hypothetical protein